MILVISSCQQFEVPEVARGGEGVIEDTTDFTITFTSPSPRADSLLKRAEFLIDEARYDSAVVIARLAKEEYTQIDSKEGIIRSENAEGDGLARWGKNGEAIKLLEDTLEKGKDWLGEDHLAMADTYNKVGILYGYRGDYISSLAFHKRAIEIRSNQLGEKHLLVGRSLNNIGVLYAEVGNFDLALEYYKRALSVRKTALGEKNVDVAQGYNNIAVAQKNRGDYEQSLLYHEQALSIRNEVLGDSHPSVGASYYNIGVTYALKNEYDLAIENHEKSLQIWQEAFPSGHPLIGLNYNALSIDYQSKGDLDKALDYEEKALLEQEKLYDKSQAFFAHSYENMGTIYKRKGEYDKAVEFYRKSLNTWKDLLGDEHPILSAPFRNMGNLYFELGNYPEALVYADSAILVSNLSHKTAAISDSISIDDYSSELKLLESVILKARILEAANRDAKDSLLHVALDTYKIAAEIIDQYSLSFKNDGSKLILAEQAASMYEEAIQVAMKLYRNTGNIEYLNTAFEFAEKGKVSVLIDAKQQAGARRFAGIPDSLLQQEKELRVLLTYYDNSLKEEETKGENADQDKIELWKKEVFVLKESYDDLVETFENEYPSYYNLKYRRYTATVSDVRENIVGSGEVLLEYVVGNDSLYIFAITDQMQKVVAVPRDSTLEIDVENMRKGIVERRREYYIPAAVRLYDLLIRPVVEMATDNKKWVVIPDGALNGIPFEALLRYEVPVVSNYHELPFVIDEHIVRYTYSATLEVRQTELRALRNVKKDPDVEVKDFVAFAPVFEEGFTGFSRGAEILNGVKPDSVDNPQWGYLPQSELEVKSINSMFRQNYPIWDRWFGGQTQLFTNKKATEAALKSVDLRSHRFIHFATHGILNEEVPELSGIVLAQDTTGGEDGVLHLGEIYNLDLDADLVVLSACQTGYGKVIKGEGLISLTRGFMYAGADALLASLWPVEDRSTQEIMVKFYQRKLDGELSADAIRDAKVALMDVHPLLAQPYYWAGFILIGD